MDTRSRSLLGHRRRHLAARRTTIGGRRRSMPLAVTVASGLRLSRALSGRRRRRRQQQLLENVRIVLAFLMVVAGIAHGFSLAKPSSLRAKQVHRRGTVWSFSLQRSGTDRCHREQRTSYSPSFSSLAAADSYSSFTSTVEDDDNVEWHVYVDQSKASLERGGSATLDAFAALAPPDKVRVHAALLPRTSKVVNKGPSIRCIPTSLMMAAAATTTASSLSSPAVVSSSTTAGIITSNVVSMDVASVDSVDKVYRVLTKHMNVKGVSTKVCNCLKYKYRGNGYLEEGKIDRAVESYNQALALQVESQRGVLLLLRAGAHLKRASSHKEQLKLTVQDLVKTIPDPSTLRAVYEEAADQPGLALALFRAVLEKTSAQTSQFRKTQHRHGLYQHSLLMASQDALEATSLLPHYGTAFFRTGEILSELWRLRESLQYYERAVALDPSLGPKVRSVTDRLQRREELLDGARSYGWTDNALRLALDVT